MKKRIAAARHAAFSVLRAVAEGGYASDLLREHTQALSNRDAGLAGELVLGSLRVQNQLDYLVEVYSGRKAGALDLKVLMALRLAIYQLRYLDRIPAHAAVNDSVEFVKCHQRAASGLVNAVLRKVNHKPVEWPSEELQCACPAWMMTRWSRHFGAEAARRIAVAALREPMRYVRLGSGQDVPLGCEATDVPGCYRVPEPVEGLRLHDISSQTIVPWLGLEPQHTFLDLCSAPGNKCAQALEAGPLLAVASDISERRLRMSLSQARQLVLDAEQPLPFSVKFDRILVDAPCSGTGTLARNPEIKWRLTEQELLRHQHRQIRILKHAAPALQPGGKILYATCSMEREENEFVIENSGLSVEKTVWRMPGQDEGDGFYAALLTNAAAS